MTDSSLYTAFVEVDADSSKMDKEFNNILNKTKGTVHSIESAFQKGKYKFDTTFAKMKLKDLEAEAKKLRAEFERKRIDPNISVASLDLTKYKLVQVENALTSVRGAVDRTESKFATGFKRIAGFVGLAVIFQQAKAAITAFSEEEKAIQKLDTALGRHDTNLIKYSADLQKLTTYGDDQIVEVMARIAAFTKEESAIKELTIATLDFANAKGIDLASAADLLSKTLGSSVNALSRYGVEIKDGANSTERLESITKAVTKLWGGQALNAAKIMSGQLEQMNNELNDQQEEIGSGILPAWLMINKIFGTVVKTAISTGKGLRFQIDSLIEGFNNLASGKINFWDFAAGSMKTAEERAKLLKEQLDKFITPAHTPAIKQIDNQLKGYTKITREIEELNERLQEENLTLDEARNITTQIEEKTKQITFNTNEQGNLADKILGKLKTELELKELTTGLTIDILESARKTLEINISLAKNDEDRVKLLKEEKKLTDDINKLKSVGIVKDLSKNPPAIKGIDFPKGDVRTQETIDKSIEDRKKAEQDLNQIRIAAIENEFTRREEEINSEFDLLKEHYAQLFEDNFITQTEMKKALDDVKESRENELSRLSQQKFEAGLSAARNISNVLRGAFGDNTLVKNLEKGLEIAEEIAAVLKAINLIGSLFNPVSAVASMSTASRVVGKEGGTFYKGKKVAPYRNIPKFSSGVSDFIVPKGFPKDSFVMRVQEDEKVNVTPAHRAGETERLLGILIGRVSAVGSAIHELEPSFEIINNAPDSETTVRKYKGIENKLAIKGVKFNYSNT